MKIFDIVKTDLLEGLEEAPEECPLAKELHFYIFYGKPFRASKGGSFTSEAKAKKALEELGMWDCINIVQKHYPKETLSPCKVANLLVLIMGRELLFRLYDGKRYYTRSPRDMPCYRLGINILEEMLVMAQQWLEENPDGLKGIWEHLRTQMDS